MFEVSYAANSQCHQELEASVDGCRSAAYWDGLLCRKLSTLHVLEINIRRWEDEVVNQLLPKNKWRNHLSNFITKERERKHLE